MKGKSWSNFDLITKAVCLSFVITALLFSLVGCQSQQPSENLANKKVIAVIPVTIDAITDFLKGLEEVVASKETQFEHLSAEGDPARFATTIKTAILKKPDILVVFGTQMSEVALGPQFRADLPITITTALSEPDKVDALVEIGVNPPRKLPIGIISDSPKISYYKVAKELLVSLIGENKKVGIIYTKGDLNAEITSKNLEKEFAEAGYTTEMGVLTTAEDASKVTKSLLLKGIDIIYLPHDKNVLVKAPTIVKLGLETEAKKVPVFSLDDGTVREKGVVAAASVSYNRVGKITGEMALEILEGANAAQLPVRRAEKADVYINLKNLKKYNINVPETLKKEAIIVDRAQ